MKLKIQSFVSHTSLSIARRGWKWKVRKSSTYIIVLRLDFSRELSKERIKENGGKKFHRKMPNVYRFFESSEISRERLFCEMELMKSLKNSKIIENFDWSKFDSSVLEKFSAFGFVEIRDELDRRRFDGRFVSRRIFFRQILAQICSRPAERKVSMKNSTKNLFVNLFGFFLIFSLIFVVFVENFDKNPTNKRNLTSKIRHVTSIDDFLLVFLVLLFFIAFSFLLVSIRISRKVFLFSSIVLTKIFFIILFQTEKTVRFLNDFRLVRWRNFSTSIYWFFFASTNSNFRFSAKRLETIAWIWRTLDSGETNFGRWRVQKIMFFLMMFCLFRVHSQSWRAPRNCVYL